MANFEAFHTNFSSCIIFVFLKSVATIYVQRLASRSVVPMWFCHLRTLWWSNAEKKIKTFWWCNFACIKEFKRIVQLSYKSLINLVICRKIPPKKVVRSLGKLEQFASLNIFIVFWKWNCPEGTLGVKKKNSRSIDFSH